MTVCEPAAPHGVRGEFMTGAERCLTCGWLKSQHTFFGAPGYAPHEFTPPSPSIPEPEFTEFEEARE